MKLLGTVALIMAAMPATLVMFDAPPAFAAGNGGGGGDGGNGGGGDGGGSGGSDSGSGSGSGAGGKSATSQQGSSGHTVDPDAPIVEPEGAGGSAGAKSSGASKPATSKASTSRSGSAKAPVVQAAPAAPVVKGDDGVNQQAARTGGAEAGGQMAAQAEATTGKPMTDLFLDLTGEDDDSDRPLWAGVPGGKDGVGGGQPDNSGTTKGDLFGDLYVILRDDNGVPILSAEGFPQPLDADGNLIPLDEDGHPLDESLAQEVEIGRLNVGRAPTSVLDRRADEVIDLFNAATQITTDAAGRLVLTVDGVEQTIDSPLENLAIYVSLMTTGTIPGVDDLPGTDFDYMVDGTYTAEDLAGSVAFLAAATDKSGEFTSDEIAYINAFIGVNTETIGSVTYSDIDYSSFTYDRVSTYADVTAEVLVQQPDGSWVAETVNVYEVVFGNANVSAEGTLDAYTQAADDALAIVDYIHEYAIPETFVAANN
ncbi:hypothetical protein [Sagittula sp. S175]|uniref:hypothetical protein n=1 Tax=Sagittula sp. S175 TaxID=3415129 RepID=UPI003C7D70C0